MASQYALRFETGERRGELVPIVGASMPGRAFTIGRKPGNSLQVTDASVSGRHAELMVEDDAGRLALRDLGSTNGTHVAGSRVEEADLGHGDVFLVGKVRFTVVDRTLEDAGGGGDPGGGDPGGGDAGGLELELDGDEDLPAVAPVSGAGAAPRPAGGEEIEISAADLARSRRSSRLAPIALVAAAAAAAAAFVLTRGGEDGDGGGGRERGSTRVEAPAGHALAGAYSFESSDLEGWSEGGGEIATFEWTSAAANSGRRGLRAELRPGQRARLLSDPVRVSDGTLVRIAAALRIDGDASARLGLDHGGGFVPLARVAARGAAEFTVLEASGAAPGSADAVRLALEVVAGGDPASASADADPPIAGTVDVDDASLVLEGGAAREPAHATGAWTVHAQSGGDGAARAVVIDWRGDAYAPLLAVETGNGVPVPLEIRGDGDEFLITAREAGTLRFVARADVVGGAVATLGDVDAGEHPGYAQHGPPFESPPGATSLLVGADASQMRIRFESGRVVGGRPRGGDDAEGAGALEFTAPVERGETLALQFDFSDERALAERLARRARQELSNDEPGVAFATWAELLETVPYSSDLVAAAGTAQSRITSEGREALAALRDEVARARFFRLGDLFREKLTRAEELQRRYAGSEVATLAAELATEIERELALLEETSVLDEAARLSAIRAALERAGASELAGEVERYRESVFPASGGGSGDGSSGSTSNGGSAGADANTPDGGGL